MLDCTEVYFKCLGDKPIVVGEILAQFSVFGHPITIHTYGAIIAFGFLLAVLLGGRIAYTWKMSLDKMIDVLIYGTIAGIVGARLYYVFSRWEEYKPHPIDVIKIWEGGLAIYGGLIGGLVAAFIVCKVRKMNFYNLLDCAAIAFLVGQGIGRWGNFFNQEAFGTNTNLPWGMKSEKVYRYLNAYKFENFELIQKQGLEIDPWGYVHPTFLYESIWCLIGVLVLYLVCRKFRKFSGQMFLWYGVWYGAERSIVEGLRTDSLYIANTGIRVSQALSVVLACVCLVLLIMKTNKYKKHPQPIDGIDFFLEEKLKAEANTEAASEVKDAQEADEATEETVDEAPQEAEDDPVDEAHEAAEAAEEKPEEE